MIEFTWDPAKNLVNQRKHGISFEEAQTVFWDDYALIEFDSEHSDNEERVRILGRSLKGNILIVVYCMRYESFIRIISSRMATSRERKEYERRVVIWQTEMNI